MCIRDRGIEAQTLANVYLAIDNDLEIIPVINKIDLPNADPERIKEEITEVIGVEAKEAPLISAKEGTGIESVLESIVKNVPPPTGDINAPLKALIFDSYYDSYRGVIASIRVKEGTIRKDSKIKMMSTGSVFEVNEVGLFASSLMPVDELNAGEVGYVAASIKNCLLYTSRCV